MHIVVGLGNPREEYARTRHNTGRMAVDFIANKIQKLGHPMSKSTWTSNVQVLVPDTFMNKTGISVARVVKSKKAAKKLIVIYDDLDLPLSAIKISYDRSSGGHKGVESIIRALKTKEFIRIRIGIGRKKDIEKHILGNLSKSEIDVLKKVFKKVSEAVGTIVEEGKEVAMSRFN